ncbi:ParD-like family protein [Pelagerythrobacter marensis]|uniref:ParD-like antitoxin of type II toxin-antitoxin system n=1 Tax=Pelagerythrobacter marensis TaxID=543877 RepID=A0A0G3X881_9SPHN|nr:ParD-like family protein [Pelagerythrobacter marensis]AKM06548.1 hypothetical protein AM2010_461 [Pelagerythrobacter marensis]
MGLVKIDEALHEQIRAASAVMCRSINAQAEFWMKIGRLAEANPTLSFNDIVRQQLAAAGENGDDDRDDDDSRLVA